MIQPLKKRTSLSCLLNDGTDERDWRRDRSIVKALVLWKVSKSSFMRKLEFSSFLFCLLPHVLCPQCPSSSMMNASGRLGHRTQRTFLKRSSLWELPGVNNSRSRTRQAMIGRQTISPWAPFFSLSFLNLVLRDGIVMKGIPSPCIGWWTKRRDKDRFTIKEGSSFTS